MSSARVSVIVCRCSAAAAAAERRSHCTRAAQVMASQSVGAATRVRNPMSTASSASKVLDADRMSRALSAPTRAGHHARVTKCKSFNAKDAKDAKENQNDTRLQARRSRARRSAGASPAAARRFRPTSQSKKNRCRRGRLRYNCAVRCCFSFASFASFASRLCFRDQSILSTVIIGAADQA
jgi:hypothetical protein